MQFVKYLHIITRIVPVLSLALCIFAITQLTPLNTTEFPKGRSELLEMISQNAPKDQITGFRHGFFALSLGYLAYGYIEAAEEVLKCIPFLALIRAGLPEAACHLWCHFLIT